MRPNYQIVILMILMLTLPVADAAYDYRISVGTHEVSFNTSSPIWEITNPSPGVTDLGYKTTYTPTTPSESAYNPMYSHSTTIVTSRNDSRPILEVTVRDFENPIPLSVMELETDTLGGLLNLIPLDGPLYWGKAIAKESNGESFGAIVDWPSDQIEIVILGRLPSTETWMDISKSLKLER